MKPPTRVPLAKDTTCDHLVGRCFLLVHLSVTHETAEDKKVKTNTARVLAPGHSQSCVSAFSCHLEPILMAHKEVLTHSHGPQSILMG